MLKIRTQLNRSVCPATMSSSSLSFSTSPSSASSGSSGTWGDGSLRMESCQWIDLRNPSKQETMVFTLKDKWVYGLTSHPILELWSGVHKVKDIASTTGKQQCTVHRNLSRWNLRNWLWTGSGLSGEFTLINVGKMKKKYIYIQQYGCNEWSKMIWIWGIVYSYPSFRQPHVAQYEAFLLGRGLVPLRYSPIIWSLGMHLHSNSCMSLVYTMYTWT